TVFQLDDTARERLRPCVRAALSIAPDETVLLLSGKLVRRKRPDLLLGAVKRLPAEKRQRMRVLVLGSGNQRPQFQTLSDRVPSPRVTHAGFQNQTRLSGYYHAADLLVLPSDSGETWGLVVNEALHHGLPCVTSDAVGSAPDLIVRGVTGEIFESGSTESLA